MKHSLHYIHSYGGQMDPRGKNLLLFENSLNQLKKKMFSSATKVVGFWTPLLNCFGLIWYNQ